MPHFMIDCSHNVLEMKTAPEIMEAVYEVAASTGLFAQNDIKVRISPYSLYRLGEGKENFLHIFAHIMEGRTIEQRAALSEKIVTRLNRMLPDLSFISVNISEFEKATYCNKALINPANKNQDRHFGL